MFTQEHQDLIDRYKVVMEFYGGDNILIKKILKTGRIVKSDIKYITTVLPKSDKYFENIRSMTVEQVLERLVVNYEGAKTPDRIVSFWVKLWNRIKQIF